MDLYLFLTSVSLRILGQLYIDLVFWTSDSVYAYDED